ncbi:MAG: late competence development ComFB family protein [Gammaproteobacteria bacterium]|nr:late competence development ComFB family protein [Gammaproteobacteria bacterium]
MEFESVHNYYERQVLEYLVQELGTDFGSDRMADVACVALNHLPPRYIRYDVDMTFYLSPQETNEMREKIAQACQDAITYVERRDAKKAT